MRELYEQIIRINQMPDDAGKQARAKVFFDSLNSMAMTDSFNWCSQVFEGIHVVRTPDKTALVYEDLALDLFKHTVNILAKFKIPRIIEFVDDVPKTISGKIRRIELQEREAGRGDERLEEGIKEYFYWDFPELSSKNK